MCEVAGAAQPQSARVASVPSGCINKHKSYERYVRCVAMHATVPHMLKSLAKLLFCAVCTCRCHSPVLTVTYHRMPVSN